MKFKSRLINRVKLILWFLFMAIWSIFSAKAGSEIVEAYVKSKKDS